MQETRIAVQVSSGINWRPYSNIKVKRAWGMAQVVIHLPSKCKGFSSNHTTTRKTPKPENKIKTPKCNYHMILPYHSWAYISERV
jgi:hypothetical protein